MPSGGTGGRASAPYFDRAKVFFTGPSGPPASVVSIDETSLKSPKTWRERTVVSEPTATAQVAKTKPTRSVTLVATVCSDGTAFTPLFLVKNTKIPAALRCEREDDAAFPHCAYRSAPKAWITTEIFQDYIIRIVVPALRASELSPTRRALLCIDNHGSRRGANGEWLATTLAQVHTDVLFLPPNTSHMTQPLDLAPFGAFKRALRTQWPAERPSWWAFMSMVHDAYELGFRSRLIRAGFLRAGLAPFNPLAVLDPTIPLDGGSRNRPRSTRPT